MELPLLAPQDFRIIAHRGASADAPENTMAAFLCVEEMGAQEVELDVRFSSDLHLVVCHDGSLERFGHPGRVVADTSVRDLQRLDMGSWFCAGRFADERMPTLAEVFERFVERFIYHVEIKTPGHGIEEALLDVAERWNVSHRLVVTSFHAEALETLHQLSPLTPVAWLVRKGGLGAENLARASAIGCQQICPPAATLVAEDVEIAHRFIPEVRAFGVKTPEDALRVIETGCDGLTINDLAWVRRKD